MSFAPGYAQSVLLADFKENSCLVLKILTINPRNNVERKNEGRKPEKTRVREDSSLCPETLIKNAVQGFRLYESLYLNYPLFDQFKNVKRWDF